VVGRGADDRQAERHVDALVEMERLERHQRLVVIEAERGVVAARGRARGTSCRRECGPVTSCLLLAQPLDRRDDDVDLLAAERAALAGMGVEPGDREPRPLDPELAPKPRIVVRPLATISSMVSRSGTSRSGTWVVTGTVRRVGPASIIATMSAATPQRSATNSVWPGWVKPIA
jgi:hypothetical protein